MFGMEHGKKTKGAAKIEFDMEVDLKDPGKLRATKEQVQERINSLKNVLRQGQDKKMFDQAQTLLHGYLAIQKVISRLNQKKA